MGAGHVRGGHGVVHQLRDLGVTRIGSLLAVPADSDCFELVAPLADAVFVLPAARDETPPPRLGVRLEVRNGEVVIAAVDAVSLAARSGLQAGDVVLSAAGAPATSASSVTSTVRNALPGTWLPLQVRRGAGTIEVIVKFPPKP
jgi:S1-C subfamily serine protease